MALGIVVVGVIAAMLAGLAWVYILPPRQKSISFETTDVSSIAAGDDIRVAGIRVGKVTDVVMESQAVRVTAGIDAKTVVGNLSRVEVRMLTPVGGYAITLVPLGSDPLQETIPKERVRVPYTIGDTLQTVPKVTDEVDTPVVQANLTEVSTALADNPSSLRSIVDGMNSVVGVLAAQRDQIHSVAKLAREYLERFNGNREYVFTLIGKIDRVLETYTVNRVGFNRAFELFGDILTRVRPIMKFYLDRSDEIRGHVQFLRDAVARIQGQIGPVIDGLTSMRESLVGWAGADPAASNPTAGLCIPVPGREC